MIRKLDTNVGLTDGDTTMQRHSCRNTSSE